MLHSVRTGGLAVALFATLCSGTTASAQEQVVPATGAAPAQATPVQTVFVSNPVIAALPATEQVRPVGAAVAGQPLERLAVTLAESGVDGADQECLANAVYFEARGEPVSGQLAVAEVVLNRSRSGQYPSDICAVVKQPAQFSFVRQGRFPAADRSSAAWKRSVAISKIALGKLASNLPSNVLWYHADYVAPSWGKRLTRKAKIGVHIFYS